MKSVSTTLILLTGVALASTAAADDTHQVRGTAEEQHAQNIFAGVFGQCRAQTGKAQGVVALIFEVTPSGRFMATSTFKESAGRDTMRALSQCMGARANSARFFPKSGATSLVGVKFSVRTDGELLVMGAGEAATLSESEIFGWARQEPTGPGA